MIKISYASMVIFISILWLLNRAYFAIKNKRISWKRELHLMLVYICLIVIARFTFCPFGTVNGQIQPLIFYTDNWFPFRINRVPFVHLFDYPKKSEALLNFIGNTAMFIPVGIVWPIVYRELNTHRKVLSAGFCFPLLIEILQLPFYDRVTDIDDLILNTLGYCTGYTIFLLIKNIKNPGHKTGIFIFDLESSQRTPGDGCPYKKNPGQMAGVSDLYRKYVTEHNQDTLDA